MNLEIVAVSLSLIHKIFLLKNNRSVAWIIGILASIVSIFYFYLIDLFVYAGAEIGFALMMLYALVGVRSQVIRDFTNFLTGIFCLILAYLTFVGFLTFLELISSLTALFGIYFLAHRYEKVGWSLSIATCLITLWVVLAKDQLFFSSYMTISLFLAMYGFYKNLPSEKPLDS